MYSGRGYRESEIGDIEVVKHGNVYHLFHLILPNHDYIAHAVSRDCMNWRRVKNALYVGEPGEWDDDMLWTMHIHKENDKFIMYYTGLNQAEHGAIQRIGCAISSNLYDWERVENDIFPIEPKDKIYESENDNPRTWISYRDPFSYTHNGTEYILVCARTKAGALHKRGCVGLIELKENTSVEHPPLYSSLAYDDIECPSLVKIKGKHFLIGSIREDVKVHYWHSDDFFGPYKAFHNNVLMPKGNYAARVTESEGRYLVNSFYISVTDIGDRRHFLPPPKQLELNEKGHLYLASYFGWKNKIVEVINHNKECYTQLNDNPTAEYIYDSGKYFFKSVSALEIFAFKIDEENYIWEGKLSMQGRGKCGLVLCSDENGNGYNISLDMVNGFAQIRAWGSNTTDVHKNFIFNDIQKSVFTSNEELTHEFKLIRYRHYIEFSIDNVVKLSLVDLTYDGKFCGVYCESSEVLLENSVISILRDIPANKDDDLSNLVNL